MGRLTVTIDRDLCQGHSVCRWEAPELFRVTEGDGPYPQVELIVAEPPWELREKLLRAAQFCPNGVIRVIETD